MNRVCKKLCQFGININSGLFNFLNLLNTCLATTSIKRIALGLSSSSWNLLQRLKGSNHVDHLALASGAAAKIDFLPKDVWVGSPSEILRKYWHQGGTILVVGAIGAATRLVAPLLINKDVDPAVVVLDERGQYVVPLLGGHKAGAEDLSFQLAEALSGIAVVTGHTRSQDLLSIDSFGESWGWIREGESSSWNELMINQAKGSNLSFIQRSGSKLWVDSFAASNSIGEYISPKLEKTPFFTIGPEVKNKCRWHPATLWIGIGCERNTSSSFLKRSLADALDKSGLARAAVAGLASIELKSDEPCLLEVASSEDWPLRFFAGEDLSKINVPNPSHLVQQVIGSPSVAEAAALLAAGERGTLLQEKIIYKARNNEYGALTIAIAEAGEPFAPSRGELHLVGSGPGELGLLTNDARFALARAVVWVGYERYLDLLEPLRRTDQVRIDFKLTFERERCLKAIELAMQGVRVALISSGDSGIYGMAGLALENWLGLPKMDRPMFQVHPGISAMQMAAARIGAPLMNDFCAISLSDYLTPWQEIKKRIKAASIGDFVVAIYNPRSQKRNWQLEHVRNLMLEQRPPSTPVVLAHQLGRKKESISLYSLDNFPVDEVDMLTIVLIGNSHSSIKDDWFVTARGY